MRSAGGAFDSLRPVRKNSTGTMNMLADELTNDQLNSIGSYTENISGLLVWVLIERPKDLV